MSFRDQILADCGVLSFANLWRYHNAWRRWPSVQVMSDHLRERGLGEHEVVRYTRDAVMAAIDGWAWCGSSADLDALRSLGLEVEMVLDVAPRLTWPAP